MSPIQFPYKAVSHILQHMVFLHYNLTKDVYYLAQYLKELNISIFTDIL